MSTHYLTTSQLVEILHRCTQLGITTEAEQRVMIKQALDGFCPDEGLEGLMKNEGAKVTAHLLAMAASNEKEGIEG